MSKKRSPGEGSGSISSPRLGDEYVVAVARGRDALRDRPPDALATDLGSSPAPGSSASASLLAPSSRLVSGFTDSASPVRVVILIVCRARR